MFYHPSEVTNKIRVRDDHCAILALRLSIVFLCRGSQLPLRAGVSPCWREKKTGLNLELAGVAP